MASAAAGSDQAKARASELKDRGNEYFGLGDSERAVKAYSEGLTLDPVSHVLFSNRAAAFLKLGNLEAAVRDARECVRLEPEWPKGYTRLAQALLRLGAYDECERALDKLEQLEPENRIAQSLRLSARNKAVFDKVKGVWHGRVTEELGGYVQTFDFLSESQVLVTVFGRQLMAKLKLDSLQSPMWLDLLVQQEPGQPAAPEVKHIFKLDADAQAMHLCSPYMTPPEQRPTAFEGAAYVRMVRGDAPEDPDNAVEKKRVGALSMASRCVEFATKIIGIVPDVKMMPEIEQMDPSSPEVQKAMLSSVRFQNAYFDLKNVYGDECEEKLQQYLMKQEAYPNKRVGEAVDKLREAMVKAGMLPSDEQLAEMEQQQQREMEEAQNQTLDTSNIDSLNLDVPALMPTNLKPTKAMEEEKKKKQAEQLRTETPAAPAPAPAPAAKDCAATPGGATPKTAAAPAAPAAPAPTPALTPAAPATTTTEADNTVVLAVVVGLAALAAATAAVFALRSNSKKSSIA